MEAFWRMTELATLNVKNFPDALYKKLQVQAKRERRSVAQEVTRLLTGALDSPKRLSILDLKGLGKEHWRNVDAAEHVEKERATWD
jgi:plasmid stability protein